MASWQKLIRSGSDAQLASLRVSGIISASTLSGSHVGDGSGLTGIIASANPAGPNQSIQFNDGGATSGSSAFTFNKTNNVVNVTGSIIATSITSSLQGSASYSLTSSYSSQDRSFGITIDGGGSVITTGIKGDITIPFNGSINGWYLTADQVGSIVIDIWRDTFGNFPPTVVDTIAGTEKPTLSSASSNSNTSLTTWTASLSIGDVIRFNVDSVSTLTRTNLVLTCRT